MPQHDFSHGETDERRPSPGTVVVHPYKGTNFDIVMVGTPDCVETAFASVTADRVLSTIGLA
jgi:hypothetical protein